MEKTKVHRKVFFTNSDKKKQEIKRLQEDFESVEVENFPVNTKHEGLVSVSIAYYHTLKNCELFDD